MIFLIFFLKSTPDFNLSAHENWVRGVSFSQNYLLSYGADTFICLWQIPDFTLKYKINVGKPVISADIKNFIAVAHTKEIKIYSFAGKLISHFLLPEKIIKILFHPTKREIVCLTERKIYVFSVPELHPLKTLSDFKKITCADFSSKYFVLCDGKKIRVFDLDYRKIKEIKSFFYSHRGKITDIDIFGDTICTCGEDGSFRLWSVSLSKFLWGKKVGRKLLSCKFVKSGRFIVLTNAENNLMVYNMKGEQVYITRLAGVPSTCAISPLERFLAVDAGIYRSENVAVFKIDPYIDFPSEIRLEGKLSILSPSGKYLAQIKGSKVEIFDTEKDEIISNFGVFFEVIGGLFTGFEDKILLWGRDAFSLYSRGGEQIFSRKIDFLPSAVDCDNFCQLIAIGKSSGDVVLFDVLKEEKYREWRAHEGRVTTLRFSPDAKLLASGGEDCFLKLWKLPEIKLLRSKKLKNIPEKIKFSMDGKMLAFSSTGKVHVINTSNFVRMGEFRANSFAFTSDDKVIFSANGRVQILNPVTGKISRTIYSGGEEHIAVRENKIIIKKGNDIKIFNTNFKNFKQKFKKFNIKIKKIEIPVKKFDIYPLSVELGLGFPDFEIKGREISFYSGGREVSVKHLGHITALCFSNTGNFVATGTSLGEVKVVNLDGEILFEKKLNDWISALCFSKDDKKLYCGDLSNNLIIFDVFSGKVLGSRKVGRYGIMAIDAGSGVLCGDGAGSVYLSFKKIYSRNLPVKDLKIGDKFFCVLWSDGVAILFRGKTPLHFEKVESGEIVRFTDDKRFTIIDKKGGITKIDPYFYLKKGDDKNPPVIIVEKPKNKEEIFTDTVTVKGFILDDFGVSNFLINSEQGRGVRGMRLIRKLHFIARDTLYFAQKITLIPGENQITIEAWDYSGNYAKKILKVYCRVKKLPKIYGIICGINEFSDENLRKLTYAEKDATEFYRFLKKKFEKGRFTLLKGRDATSKRFMKMMKDLKKILKPEDFLILYFATHGLTDGKELYLSFYDGNLSEVDFNRLLRGLNCKILIIADICHGGYLGLSFRGSAQFFENLLRFRPGIALFTASSADELSYESPSLSHGVFTYYLIEGLKGKADKNEDKIITLREIYEYVYDRVKTATKDLQHPELKGTLNKNLPVSYID